MDSEGMAGGWPEMEDVFPNSTANETSAVKAFVEDLEG